MTVLQAEQVGVRFGGKVALEDVDLEITPRSVTGLIGPNGAGKTTLFNVLSGMLAPTSGRVRLDGKDVTGASSYRRARLGAARTFQRLELFGSLSVRDNLRVATDIKNAWSRRRSPKVGAADVDRVLARTGLEDVADREAGTLPTGRARVVELARALMIDPKVLLLDEPASGQSEEETAAFSRLLTELAAEGLAICLVEHDMSLVMDVCERIAVLDYGRVIASGTPEDIRNDPAVIDAYLGSTATT